MSFGDLQQALHEHFEGETLSKVQALQRLKQEATPLCEFNKKFVTTAAPALSQMSPM